MKFHEWVFIILCVAMFGIWCAYMALTLVEECTCAAYHIVDVADMVVEEPDCVGGELHYDPETQHIIALSEKGAFELALDGSIIHSNLEIKLNAGNWAKRRSNEQAAAFTEWQYDTIRHRFYRFKDDTIETKSIQQ